WPRIGLPSLGCEIVELAVVNVGARSAEWFLPILEPFLTPGRREGEIVSNTRRRFRTCPRRIIRLVVVKSRDDARDGSEIAERRDTRLNLGALEGGEPIFAVDFGVDELDE